MTEDRIKELGQLLTESCQAAAKDIDRIRVVAGLATSPVRSMCLALLQYSLLAARRAGIDDDDAMALAALCVGRAFAPELSDIKLREIDDNVKGRPN